MKKSLEELNFINSPRYKYDSKFKSSTKIFIYHT